MDACAAVSRKRAGLIARHIAACGPRLCAGLTEKSLWPEGCIGENGQRIADSGERMGGKAAAFMRTPLRVAFADPSAAHDRYGGSGAHVVLEGELLQPASSPAKSGGTVLVLMHPGGVLSSLPIVSGLARAGLHVCAMASRYGNNDSTLIVEKVCVDLGAVVKHLKTVMSYTTVVLVGWSGGGGLVTLYQSLAEHPLEDARTPAGDAVALHDLPPADGVALLAAHAGRARIFSEWIDPAVMNEADPGTDRDSSVDIYGPAAPGPPFSAGFVARYRSAQRARVRRITAWVTERLRQLQSEQPESGGDWRRGRRDITFMVPCTQADISRLDATLDPSDRTPEALDALAEENHSPVGLARFTTLRSWLSQWSLDHSRADSVAALRKISAPVLVLANGADNLVPPAHAQDMFDAIPHARKQLHTVKGASHYYLGQRAELKEAVSICCSWLLAEGLLPEADRRTSESSAEEPMPAPLKLDELRPLTGEQLTTRLDLRGINHLALVSSDMSRTTRFICEQLGMPLVKTIELAGGAGQHFFFDAGNGCCLAYFWWPNAPPPAPGIAAPVDSSRMASEEDTHTAVGSMNHVAWAVPLGRLAEYRKTLKSRGVQCSPILHHADVPEGYVSKPGGNTTFSSFYFRGPDGEFFELTEQYRGFGPEDVAHEPKTRADAKRS